jgi:hypothetical protein
MDSSGTPVTVPSNTVTVTVDALPVTTAPGPSVASGGIDVGQPVTFTTSASGGSGGYTYTWTQSSSNFGCNVASTSDTMVCTPTVAGTYTVSVYATDSNGGNSITETSASFVVDALPTTTTPSPNPVSVDAGQSVTFTTTASGGSGGPYTYTWSTLAGLGCAASTAGSITCSAPTDGSYSISVYVTDSNGGISATATLTSFVVYGIPVTTTQPTPSLSSGGIDVGQSVTFTTTAGGGSGGYLFTWLQSDPGFGCVVASTGNTLVCTPTAAGTYYVTVNATDSNGVSSAEETAADFTVDTLPTTTQPSPSIASGGIDVGQSVTFTTTAGNGSGDYAYSWAQSDPGFGCLIETFDSITCTPTVAGTYTVSVFVIDSNGGISPTNISASFLVDTLPVSTTPSPSVPSVDLNQSVTFTTAASGGSGGYTYWWMQSSPEMNCTLVDADSVSCTPTLAGTYTVSVFVTDSNGGASSTVTFASFVVYALPVVATVPSPSVASGLVDVGQSFTFTTSASGGSGGYTYRWTQSDPAFGCHLASTTNSISCAPTTAGTYTVTVYATDSNGVSSVLEVSFGFTIDTLPATTEPAPSVASGLIDVGQSITFTTTASGGSGGYTYTWTQSSMGMGCTLANAATITCVPTAGGTYTVSVFVTDSNSGNSGTENSASFLVDALPTATAPSPSVASVDLGQSVTFTTVAGGGSGGYTYSWTPSSVDLGCTIVNAASITCTPTATGTYTLSVFVTDSNSGNSVAESSAAFVVDTLPATTTPTPSVTSGLIDVGQSVMFTTSASGGSGGYTYTWSQSSSDLSCSLVNAASITCTPTVAGTYNVTVYVSDSNGGRWAVETSLSYLVNPALTAPAAPTPSVTSLDANQDLTVTATLPSTGTPTYAWEWLVSVNGGAYAPASQCAVNSGTGAAGGTTETCSIAANTLTAGDTYSFELEVTDSAASPSSQVSAATAAVTVVSSPSSSSSSYWVYAVIAVVVLLAVILAALVVRRRRRSPAKVVPPVQASEAGAAPAARDGPPAVAPAYVETPKDVGQAPPEVLPMSAAGAAAATTAPAASGAESDFAALMAELDKISGEVQKKPTKTGTSDPDVESAKEGGKSS